MRTESHSQSQSSLSGWLSSLSRPWSLCVDQLSSPASQWKVNMHILPNWLCSFQAIGFDLNEVLLALCSRKLSLHSPLHRSLSDRPCPWPRPVSLCRSGWPLSAVHTLSLLRGFQILEFLWWVPVEKDHRLSKSCTQHFSGLCTVRHMLLGRQWACNRTQWVGYSNQGWSG